MPKKFKARRNKKTVYRRKRAAKKAVKKVEKRVEMIRLSEGSSKCQAITPIYHKDDDPTLVNFNLRLPVDTYFRLTSSSNISDPAVYDLPLLSQRIEGNSCYSKYLNYRYRIEFDNVSNFEKSIRTRVIAGTFMDAPEGAPWNGWTSDQAGTPNAPTICDSDTEGSDWIGFMTKQLSAFYSGEQIWGGLLEKARWNVIHDKTYVRNPVTSTETAVQQFTGNTPAWTAGYVGGGDGQDPGPYSTVSGAPGLNAGTVSRTRYHTRKPIEDFIDFSKTGACNKKLYYGPNVDSSKPASNDANQDIIYRPDAGGQDRGLASTTARNVPFVLILQPDFDEYSSDGTLGLTERWCHYLQDA